MEKFAGYGFNKSHSAAYALVAYQTAYFKAHHAAAFMAANLSLVMDDTDKVRALLRRCARAGTRRSCRRTSTRRTTASSRSTRSASATASAASRARASRRSRRSSPRARAAGRSATCSTSAAASTSASSTAASIEALVRAGAFDAIDARRAALLASVGIALDAAERARCARRRRCRCSARRRIERAGADRHPRLDRRRAAGPREGGARLLPVGPPVRRLRRRSSRRSCARRSPNLAAAQRARAGRRHRHCAARADRPARQDGVRHARRRQRPRGDPRLQRDVRRVARAAARGPARRSPRCASMQRVADDGEVAGHAHHRRSGLRPRRVPQALGEGARSSPATATRRPTASRRSCDRSVREKSRSPSPTAMRASAAKSTCRRTGASISTTR